MVFRNWNSHRNAIGGARAREHNPIDTGRPHGVEQNQRANDVVLVINRRVLHRDAHIRERGEVHHRFDPVLFHRGNHPLTIEQVDRDRMAAHRPPGDAPRQGYRRSPTSWPAFTSCFAAWEPTYPAPPVTNTAHRCDLLNSELSKMLDYDLHHRRATGPRRGAAKNSRRAASGRRILSCYTLSGVRSIRSTKNRHGSPATAACDLAP